MSRALCKLYYFFLKINLLKLVSSLIFMAQQTCDASWQSLHYHHQHYLLGRSEWICKFSIETYQKLKQKKLNYQVNHVCAHASAAGFLTSFKSFFSSVPLQSSIKLLFALRSQTTICAYLFPLSTWNVSIKRGGNENSSESNAHTWYLIVWQVR